MRPDISHAAQAWLIFCTNRVDCVQCASAVRLAGADAMSPFVKHGVWAPGACALPPFVTLTWSTLLLQRAAGGVRSLWVHVSSISVVPPISHNTHHMLVSPSKVSAPLASSCQRFHLQLGSLATRHPSHRCPVRSVSFLCMVTSPCVHHCCNHVCASVAERSCWHVGLALIKATNHYTADWS